MQGKRQKKGLQRLNFNGTPLSPFLDPYSSPPTLFLPLHPTFFFSLLFLFSLLLLLFLFSIFPSISFSILVKTSKYSSFFPQQKNPTSKIQKQSAKILLLSLFETTPSSMGTEPPPPPPPLPPPQSPPRLLPPPPTPATATSLAPGFRFHPTDQELVSYYLKRKICGKPIRFDAISETDIYKSEPWDLPALSKLKSRDNEWYFFGVQDRKYVNGSRVNRATGKGYWKATGNDRPIIHNFRTVGMKKTLVFYSGRAPCGKRTNWVMHEYRLTDEELAKSGVVMDAYLLCKILKKSGPGFKPGEQYGPFVEEEWEKDESTLVPGEEGDDEAAGNDDARVEDSMPSMNNSESAPVTSCGFSTEVHEIPPLCKIERAEEGPVACTVDPEPLSLGPNKRFRPSEPDTCHSNASEISTTITQGPCSSSTGTTNFSSGLLEFPLLESVEPKERPSPPPANVIDINVPPSYLKLFEELRNEIYRTSIEKESLKIEVMSARTMINILQTKIDHLTKENEDLKKSNSQDG